MMLMVMAVTALPVAAAEEGAGVNLPGWVAWLLIILAVGLVVIAGSLMRRSATS